MGSTTFDDLAKICDQLNSGDFECESDFYVGMVLANEGFTHLRPHHGYFAIWSEYGHYEFKKVQGIWVFYSYKYSGYWE